MSAQPGRNRQERAIVDAIERRVIEVEGIVQGVGFRPYVHRLATARRLSGFVRNEIGGLFINVQGRPEALDDFVRALTSSPPPLAVIRSIRTAVAEIDSLDGFSIVDSGPAAGAGRTFVSPDIATCDDCVRELFDSRDRRYRYPFINCTHCGPRLTIVRDLPYDRPNTTMGAFSMCRRCREEYEDPADRRFHAQPIACPDCGPTLKLVSPAGTEQSGGHEAVADAATALLQGAVVAIKGLGGYHIACDATSASAVRQLRLRKHREARPFALMVGDIGAALRLCAATRDELDLLESRERPIVLMRRKRAAGRAIKAALDEIAPGTGRLGVMLPYTPIHHLLMSSVGKPVVMTSGNLADEPIAYEDSDALARLGPLVDAILTHDRPIATRCDDSVMLVSRGVPAFMRRSRGFAPRPMVTTLSFPQHVLAVGGQLKNTFCLAKDSLAFVSHHIGDLDDAASFESFVEGIRHYTKLVGVDAKVVAHDLHPDYRSTRLAEELGIASRIAVQHHHAHAASCMAEHGLVEPVIGVVFDGAGLGDDGAIWGGEFLLICADGHRRVGHLAYVPLPGGDAAARWPSRMAVSHLLSAFGPEGIPAGLALIDRVPTAEMRILGQMMEKGINSPPTSSIGRLFDAVAALVGVRDSAQFEGQAAMELETIADTRTGRSYPVDVLDRDSMLIPDPGSLIRAVGDDLRAGVAREEISGAFHNSLVGMIAEVGERIRGRTGVNRIALSGGVFQNVLLLTRSAAALERAGFEVFTQRLVPCNDGGLALGQAYVTALRGGEV